MKVKGLDAREVTKEERSGGELRMRLRERQNYRGRADEKRA